MRLAIVGLGPWGLCALERTANRLRSISGFTTSTEIHLVEPRHPGIGIYDVTQPDYLVMNNSCAEIILPAAQEEGGEHAPAVGLYEWAAARGYRWVGHTCAIGPSGAPIDPGDFLPRRVMGEYLHWVYRGLVAGLSVKTRIVHHPTTAVDLIASGDQSETVRLADGSALQVDHVLLTLGHVANAPANGNSRPLLTAPYPITRQLHPIPSEAKVAIAGMGLVAMDVLWSFTVGRGGRFVRRGQAFEYEASGREPAIQLLSRNGQPSRSKTALTETPGSSERKRPIIFTHEAIQRLRSRGPGTIDFRADVLPLLLGEMTARYYAQSVFAAKGARESALLLQRFREAGPTHRFAEDVADLADTFGSFEAESLFFGGKRKYESSEGYHAEVCHDIVTDIEDATSSGFGSPTTAAVEVFRLFRDSLRSVVDYNMLTLESYLDFQRDIRTRINRLVAGHPIWRLRQLLALVEAGVVRFPYGPEPALERDAGAPAGTRIRSTALTRPFADRVDFVVQGYLEDPRLDCSSSPLLARLHARGRLTSSRYGDRDVGSVRLTPRANAIDIASKVQDRVWVFGPLTEGLRYFTHYVPSPTRGSRAFEEIGACIGRIFPDGTSG